MDYTSFCGEIFRLLSARLPASMLPGQDPAETARTGGWYYPSARDRSAWFFDCRNAYRQYLAGVSVSAIADTMEYSLLLHQWDSLPASLRPEPAGGITPEWALRLRPFSGPPPDPSASLCLLWDRYLMEPCCRFLSSDSLLFQPVNLRDMDILGTDEAGFWARLWEELPLQDPPVLSAILPDGCFADVSSETSGQRCILTGQRGLYGAAVLFYPGLAARLNARFSGFMALVSSPHEAVLFPGDIVSSSEEAFRLLYELREKAGPADTDLFPELYQYTVEAGLIPV